MNLLGSVLYDPAVAVSNVTTSLLAMTALDTTNLRLTVTVPAHGRLYFRLKGIHHGATTSGQHLFGVLSGATVIGRLGTLPVLLGTAVATTRIQLSAEFAVSGLTPGSTAFDAAYGVEIVSSANGAIKYGGPNNATTNDAYGGFLFEIWDPSPAVAYAAEVRTNLTTELGRIDVAVSSRLATVGYTAPLDAAGTRTALGLATADLDSQLAAELAQATLARKILKNRTETDPATGIMTVYDDDGTTPLYTANIFTDVAGATAYDGTAGVNRRNALA
jgi:hypothetical protein